MAGGFVAITLDPAPPSPEVMQALVAAGAARVLGWAELAAPSDHPIDPDEPAVLFDLRPGGAVPQADLDDVLRVLAALAPVIDGHDGRGAVVVTTRPVIDTLKLVDAGGVLTGTADRDEHRFVRLPLATRLGLLQAVAASGHDAPDGPMPVLAALVDRGATALSGGA